MKELKLSSKVVYSMLNYISNIENPITVRNEFIADKLDISIDTVKRALSELKKVKLIEITNNNRYRSIRVNEPSEISYLEGVISTYMYEREPELTREQENALNAIWERL